VAQPDTRGDSTKAKSAKPSGPLQVGTQGLASLIEIQRELVGTFEQIRREQLARAMEETSLIAELAGKVTSAKSVPDVVAIYQEWITRHMKMFAEDSRRFLDDSQKVASVTARLLSNREGGSGGTT